MEVAEESRILHLGNGGYGYERQNFLLILGGTVAIVRLPPALLAAGDCAWRKGKAVTCDTSGGREPDPILERVLHAMGDGLPQRA